MQVPTSNKHHTEIRVLNLFQRNKINKVDHNGNDGNEQLKQLHRRKTLF